MRRSFLFLFLIATASQAMSGDSDDNCESSGERKRRRAVDIPEKELPIKKRFYRAIPDPEKERFQVAQPRGQEAETEAPDLSLTSHTPSPPPMPPIPIHGDLIPHDPRGIWATEDEVQQALGLTKALDPSVHYRSSYQDVLTAGWGNGAFTPYVKTHRNPRSSAGAPSDPPLEAGFSQTTQTHSLSSPQNPYATRKEVKQTLGLDSQPTTLIFIGAKPQDQEFSKEKRLMDILFQSRGDTEKVSWGYAIPLLTKAGITYNEALTEYSKIRKKIKEYYNQECLISNKNFWNKWPEISTDRNLLREILMSNHPRKKSKTLS
jgi:hypothetical protein